MINNGFLELSTEEMMVVDGGGVLEVLAGGFLIAAGCEAVVIGVAMIVAGGPAAALPSLSLASSGVGLITTGFALCNS